MSKTLLLLGGSAAQVIAIDKARELGYRTVLCDYLPDNPGQYHADSFYLVSTTDREAVLEVARKERIDGVVAYSSDPAAPTAAYVADVLGLPGVPYATAQAFCEKHLFREFLVRHGFNAPRSVAVDLSKPFDPLRLDGFRLPFVVKPADSSGSKGVVVVRRIEDVAPALAAASRFSRDGVGIVEEFVVRDHPHVIEAEIFVKGGQVSSWGLISSIRDDASNPLLPAGYSYPLDLPAERIGLVRSEVARLVSASGVADGAFNIEMVIDAGGRLFFLDAGPRNGGNMLPEFISMISGKDLVKATILAAMGDTCSIDVGFDGFSGGCWGLGVLHSSEDGIFSSVFYSEKAASALVREEIQMNPGDPVRAFSKCTDLVGLAFFKFVSRDERDEVMFDMGRSMHIELASPQCDIDDASFIRVRGVSALSQVWDQLSDAFDPPLKVRVVDYESHLKRVADNGISFACVSAKKELLGCVSFYCNNIDSKQAFVSEIMVSPHVQGRGLGSAMLSLVERWAKLFGMNYIRLEVLKDNHRAHQLYTRLGYEFVRDTKDGYLLEKELQ